MDRRKFLRDATQFGVGLGTAQTALGQSAATLSAKLQDGRAPTPITVLDGQWTIATDPENVGRTQKWFQGPTAGARSIRVPGILQEAFPGYHGVVWYWRDFQAEVNPYAKGRYLLEFDVVDYLAEVWVNGVYIGSHESAETPFVLDITNATRSDASNRLAVRVLNPDHRRIDDITLDETPNRDKTLSFNPGHGYDTGGICQPVVLVLTAAVRVDDLYLRPDWKTGKIAVEWKVSNAFSKSTLAHCYLTVSTARDGKLLLLETVDHHLPSGDTTLTAELAIESHLLWDLENPFLYRVTVRVETTSPKGCHEKSANCGFRDFRVANGYFRLNGKRLFLRSTHTGNQCPYLQVWPPAGFPDLLRLDLIYAKTVGFNTVRFIGGVPLPYQLDLCDELGLLVYEESVVSWLLHNSPKMKEQYQSSMRGMILRDRNHPCIAIWGMLNETNEGPVFHQAVASLDLVRSLDPTRLVLLSSGRWDGELGIGSVSNPGSSEWECVWGDEMPGAGKTTAPRTKDYPDAHGVAAYNQGMGDIHFYPEVPPTAEVSDLLRTMGRASKPIFLSETGIGSMMDVFHEARYYEQAKVPSDAGDYQLIKSQADRLTEDWERWGMAAVYPFPEWLLRASQVAMARHRLLIFNLVRSNPKFCGYSLTGMLDHGFTGEGLWRYWRDFKPGALDAVKDGWASVRWCLFVNPTHTYVGRPVKLEAVLANEDVLSAGEYAVRFRVWGPSGVAWDRASTIRVALSEPATDGALAIPALEEKVNFHGPAGAYSLIPSIERGAAPPETSWEFHLSDPASLPTLDHRLTLWGVPSSVEAWLKAHGASTESFPGNSSGERELILVGDLSHEKADASAWKELASRMARGSYVIFLSPSSFQRGNESTGWLPLANKGRVYKSSDGLYHKECVAKAHPVFEGLQAGAILDWYYYGQMIPRFLFDGQDTPADVVAATFATGFPVRGGYVSGILLGSYPFGAGQFLINTFPILDYIDSHPVADRMLINAIRFAAKSLKGPLQALPSDFDAHLRTIGYS
jgi:hypothetical protein